MTLLSIAHVQLAMPAGEEQKARLFYVELLGLVEIPKPASLAARGGVWFRSGSVEIHLGVEPDFRPARKAHPAFLVENLDLLIEKLRLAGVRVDLSQPPLVGFERLHFFDPFGNRLELMQAT